MLKTWSPRGASTTWLSYLEIIVLLKMLSLGSPTEVCSVATISSKGYGKQNRPPRAIRMALAAALIPQQHLGRCSDKLWGQILQQQILQCSWFFNLCTRWLIVKIDFHVIFILECRVQSSLERSVTVRFAFHYFSNCCLDD